MKILVYEAPEIQTNPRKTNMCRKDPETESPSTDLVVFWLSRDFVQLFENDLLIVQCEGSLVQIT